MTTISIAGLREQRAIQQRRRRRLVLAGLLTPITLLLVFLFIFSLIQLFTYSAYHFTGIRIERTITFEAYPEFFSDPFHWDVLGRSLHLAAVITLIALAIGYPTAYAIARLKDQRVALLMYILIFSPLLTSVVIRAFGWIILLGDNGFINYALIALGLTAQPIRLIYNFEGVTIALVHVLLPFTVFPIISVMNQIDPMLKEAAQDLGASRWQTFWRVTFPLTLPGLIAGAQTTFVLAVSAFATPSIMGGGRVLVLPRMIYESIVTRNWPLAAVQAMVLLSISLVIIFISNQLFKVVYRVPQEQRA